MTLQEFSDTYGIETNLFESYLTLLSIKPFLNEKCFIGGGFILDCLQGTIPKDVDVFFTDEEAHLNFQNNYSKKYKIFKVDTVYRKNSQVLGYQTIEQRLSHADFTITQFVYDGTFLYFGENTVNDMKEKCLTINRYPLSKNFVTRLNRYFKKGYSKVTI